MHRQSHLQQYNEATCNTATSQFIHASDHTLNFGECPLFKTVIYSSCLTRKQYEPPKRDIVGVLLLEENFKHVKVNNDTQLQKDLFMYNMTEIGDGETTVKMTLFNELTSTYGTSPVVLKVYERSRHLAGEGKTYADYIATILLP